MISTDFCCRVPSLSVRILIPIVGCGGRDDMAHVSYRSSVRVRASKQNFSPYLFVKITKVLELFESEPKKLFSDLQLSARPRPAGRPK